LKKPSTRSRRKTADGRREPESMGKTRTRKGKDETGEFPKELFLPPLKQQARGKEDRIESEMPTATPVPLFLP